MFNVQGVQKYIVKSCCQCLPTQVTQLETRASTKRTSVSSLTRESIGFLQTNLRTSQLFGKLGSWIPKLKNSYQYQTIRCYSKMEDIKDVSLGPMPASDFIKPLRMKFTQNGRPRIWDMVKIHESVSCVLFNTSRNVLIFVKQFRPAVFYSSAVKHTPDNSIDCNNVDWTKVSPKLGITLELCAGIVDANIPLNEVMKKEVLEECGYDVPVSNFETLICFRSGIGISGDKQTLFYAECTDQMKKSEGGGLVDEGELIDVVEMSIPEVEAYIAGDTVTSPGGFLYAMTWFLQKKAPKRSTR